MILIFSNYKHLTKFFTVILLLCTYNISFATVEFIEGDLTSRSIVENSQKDTKIGVPVRFTIDDANGCISVQLHGDDANFFSFTHEYRRIQLRTNSKLDYETKNRYEVLLTASNNNSSDTINLIINVVDVKIIFTDKFHRGENDTILRFIEENSEPGTEIGLPITASVVNGNDDNLRYSLSEKDTSMFHIDEITGQLRTEDQIEYDGLEKNANLYKVIITATDGNESSIIPVEVRVQPINEHSPTFSESTPAFRIIHKNSSPRANVGAPLSASDTDNDLLEYYLSDEDIESGVFELDPDTGQLRTLIRLNRETKSEYFVLLFVTDGTHVAAQIVIVTVICDDVNVPDRNLAAMIRHELGLNADEDITIAKLEELTTLAADGETRLSGLGEIEDLTGLEFATNLTTLLLTSNSVSDLTPIQGLTNLTTLEIYANRISSYSPLSNMTSLRKLNIGFNYASNITPLKGLKNLRELHLRSNSISDITPLEQLVNLEILNLNDNNITDLSSLEGLSKLRELYLAANTSLIDVNPLSGLINLEKLDLRSCPIEDRSPLSNLNADIIY